MFLRHLDQLKEDTAQVVATEHVWAFIAPFWVTKSISVFDDMFKHPVAEPLSVVVRILYDARFHDVVDCM